MGLSQALWNSRYWLAGLHLLFLIALWVAFLILVMVLYSAGLRDPHVWMQIGHTALMHWYIPFLALFALWLIAGLLAAQAPLELTRSDMADAVGQSKLQNRLESLCIARNLPPPKLYIVDYPSLNALIWGRSEFRLYITKNAIDQLTLEELDAVMAQQLGHLHNGDNHVFPMMSLFIMVGSQMMLWALAGLALLVGNSPSAGLGPAIVPLMLTATSFGVLWLAFRNYGGWSGSERRFAGDLFGIQLSQNALALIGALEKAKLHARMPIVPDEWRTLAFVDLDPALTLPWYPDPDDRIVGLRKTLGLSIFGER